MGVFLPVIHIRSYGRTTGLAIFGNNSIATPLYFVRSGYVSLATTSAARATAATTGQVEPTRLRPPTICTSTRRTSSRRSTTPTAAAVRSVAWLAGSSAGCLLDYRASTLVVFQIITVLARITPAALATVCCAQKLPLISDYFTLHPFFSKPLTYRSPLNWCKK